MKFGEILTELRNALTVPTKGSLAKAVVLLLSILVTAVALSLILQQFFPEEELEKYAEYGYSGVFLVTLVSSMSIVLPLPGTVVVIAAADIWNPLLIALVASIGGTLGEISGYILGYGGRAVISQEHTEGFKTAQEWMKRRGGLGIFLFALIPFLIFDFIGIAAGIFRYPLKKFLLFTWLGRLPRSLIEIYIGVALLDFIIDHLTF